MRKWKIAGLLAVLAMGSSAQAQSTFYWPPMPTPTGEGRLFYLPMGTPLMLRTRTQISTKDNKPGDRVYLEVAETVSFRGQVVIPIGSPVLGEVSRVQRNGHFERKGKLEIRLIQVETPNGPVRLTGTGYDEGKSGTAASVATMVLVSGLGFLIHGTSGELKPGTAIQAYLAEPLHFTYFPQQATQTAMIPVQPDSVKLAAPGFQSLDPVTPQQRQEP